MKSSITQVSAVAILTLAFGFVPAASAKNSGHGDTVRGLSAAEGHRRGVSAHDLIGQDVRSNDGKDLGEIQDLVVDTSANRVDYALISSGGVLGIGDTIRAVPFAAFHSGVVTEGALTLDVTRATFESGPKMEDKDIAVLGSQRKSLDSYYGVSESIGSKLKSAMSDQQPMLQRTSKILGQNVVNSGQNVGDIEDILVNFENRHATVLIDPNDDYTSTDKKFLISFKRLQRTPDGDSFSTDLTKNDFAQAAPADANSNWWDSAVTTPLVWGGYDSTGYAPASRTGVATSDTAMANRDTAMANNDHNGSTSSPTPISQVDRVLHNDSSLKGELKHVSLQASGANLMIQGSVRNEDLKDQVADKVEDAAKGWDVQNQLYVQNDQQ